MLKGISPLISPELLATLSMMGHGDEIILADAHFPADSFNENVPSGVYYVFATSEDGNSKAKTKVLVIR